MRPARTIMAELAATGMTPEQIALVMELSAAVSAEARPVTDEAADRRRERDREYQAQKRAERRQISAESDDITDSAPLSRPPNENNSNPPTHTPENKSRARKGTRLAEDWVPEPLTGKALDMVSAWPAGAIERELAKFKNYWLAKTGAQAVKVDWQRTWVNWLISADERIAKHGNNRNSGGAGAGKADAWQSVLHDVANGPPDPRPPGNNGGMQGAQGMGGNAIGCRA